MTPSTIDHTATALRLAARGVTVTGLAEACGITRQSAHAILFRLRAIGALKRAGSQGRGGHVYKLVGVK